MWDNRSFAGQSFDGRSWLGLLTTPYRELTRVQRVSVRSGLATVYTTRTVDRLVTLARRGNVSVLEAEAVLMARSKAEALSVVKRVRKSQVADSATGSVGVLSSTDAVAVFQKQSVVLARVSNDNRAMEQAGEPGRAISFVGRAEHPAAACKQRLSVLKSI